MTCEHVKLLPDAVPEPEDLTHCEDCVRMGQSGWAHLRMCLSCGHVACCDSSPYRHATAHYFRSDHPVMRSAEPGEDWRWCYSDHRLV